MTTLRDRVVEAMLTAEKEAGFLTDPTATELVLDAALDCLTENADEWVEGAGRLVLTTDSIYEALIATLREPTDG